MDTWTSGEDAFLRDNFGTMTISAMAKHIGKKKSTVSLHCIKRLGLRKRSTPRPVTEEDRREILRLYVEEHRSIPQIALATDRAPGIVGGIVREAGATRDIKERTAIVVQQRRDRGVNRRCYLHRGYVLVYRPDRPEADKNGYALEHRLVVEEALGHAIGAEKVVHHINGIKNDNRPENLAVLSQIEHSKLHNDRYTDEDIIDALRYAAQQTGAAPRRADYRKSRRLETWMPSDTLICLRFGTWQNALSIAGLARAPRA